MPLRYRASSGCSSTPAGSFLSAPVAARSPSRPAAAASSRLKPSPARRCQGDCARR